jgi:hypothetical protein
MQRGINANPAARDDAAPYRVIIRTQNLACETITVDETPTVSVWRQRRLELKKTLNPNCLRYGWSVAERCGG